ncbi:MAG TPA: polysaccharide biosynthesis tyrosine autokinase [Puia sp.]|jgi:capsular exopolysaccharide synthesis family protein|nr:polysaccharide biosynthesis tyrosine autokinase [Puia sp.]
MADTDIRTPNSFQTDGRATNMLTEGPKEFLFKYLHYLPWIILSCALFLVGAYVKIRYTTQIYSVQSSLLIKNDQENQGGQEARFDQLLMSGNNVNLKNEIEILKSRPILTRVAKDLGLETFIYNTGKVRSSLLYPEHPFNLQIYNLGDSIRGFDYNMTILDDNRYLLGQNKTPVLFGQVIMVDGNRFCLIRNKNLSLHIYSRPTFEFGWTPLSNIAASMIGSLSIGQLSDQATILSLSYETENPSLGQDVLNTVMAVYDTLIVEDKRRTTSNMLQFIQDRLNEMGDTLKGVQGVLKQFIVENQAFDIEGQSKSYLDKMGESGKQDVEQQVKIKIVNFLLKYIDDQKNKFELVPTNLGIEEPALQQLILEYNRLQLERDANLKTTAANNPMIQALEGSLNKVRTNIYQALLNVRQAYEIASANLAKQNEDLQSRIKGLPGKSIQLLNFERQQKIFEDLYSLLLQKKLETSISAAATVSNSRIVEPAMSSDQPVRPNKKNIYISFFLIGLAIPCGLIGMKEVLRDKVSGRADVEKFTTAPILGEIGHSDYDQPLVVTRTSRRFISEQFRIIRTNLQYIISNKEKVVIMVTSSFSGEGKSFISTNMGAVMAVSGKKTVIIEFDIRKPKIVSGLDLKRKMGITNYIIGKASFEELLVKVEDVDDLYVIPCGPIPPNPAELLLDRKLDELMKEVMANFDVVILDTAPVGLVSDALGLARFADCTLYIIRQGHTFRKQLGFIEELYVEKKLPRLCLLLNDMKPEGGYYGGYYGGGYGYYTGYSYGNNSGYFEEETNRKSQRTIFGRIKRFISRIFF